MSGDSQEVSYGAEEKQPKFRCKSEAQKKAIAANYARMAAQKKRSAPPLPVTHLCT